MSDPYKVDPYRGFLISGESMLLIVVGLYVITGIWLGLKYYIDTGFLIRSILVGIFWFLIVALQDDPVRNIRDKHLLKCRMCWPT
jgi:hypothetical protein